MTFRGKFACLDGLYDLAVLGRNFHEGVGILEGHPGFFAIESHVHRVGIFEFHLPGHSLLGALFNKFGLDQGNIVRAQAFHNEHVVAIGRESRILVERKALFGDVALHIDPTEFSFGDLVVAAVKNDTGKFRIANKGAAGTRRAGVVTASG